MARNVPASYSPAMALALLYAIAAAILLGGSDFFAARAARTSPSDHGHPHRRRRLDGTVAGAADRRRLAMDRPRRVDRRLFGSGDDVRFAAAVPRLRGRADGRRRADVVGAAGSRARRRSICHAVTAPVRLPACGMGIGLGRVGADLVSPRRYRQREAGRDHGHRLRCRVRSGVHLDGRGLRSRRTDAGAGAAPHRLLDAG